MSVKTETFVNYYELLHVAINATEIEITKAYRTIIKEKHPDNFLNASENELLFINQIFNLYTTAYKTLKSPLERQKYDNELKRQLNIFENNEILKEQKEKIDVQVKNDKNNSPKNDLSKFSSIENDPRLNTATNFTFSKMSYVDTNKDLKDLDEIKHLKELKQTELFKKGKSFIEQEKYANAINIFRELLEYDSKNSNYHAYLALASLKKGWLGYAYAEFKVALNCNPNNEMALTNFSRLKKELDEKNEKSIPKRDNFFKNIFFKNK